MNERILELYKQAYGHFPSRIEKPEAEEFAELIVLECADFIEQDQGSGNALANRLSQHFGVDK